LAFTFGKRKDKVFKELQAMLKPFGIGHYYSDDWGAYTRNINPTDVCLSIILNLELLLHEVSTIYTHHPEF